MSPQLRDAEASSHGGAKLDLGPDQDFSLREGQTISISIKTKKPAAEAAPVIGGLDAVGEVARPAARLAPPPATRGAAAAAPAPAPAASGSDWVTF